MGDAATPAVGIDLGTVFSVVAYVDQDGKPCTIPNAEGDLTTPSVVWFHEEGVVVGKEAVKAARHDPDRVAAFAKRDMGEAYYARAMGGERLPPEVVQSLVLGKLRSDAELMLGPFEKAVITVPAYFNEPRRKATQDAGRLAGLEVIDIINEPTAAAIAYGVRHGYLSDSGAAREPETVLVYDLGGGTFDVTVMRIDGFSYETVATAGDVYLGGIDWDSRIVRYLAEQFIEQHGLDPRDDPRALARLLQEAEDAKRALSVRSDVWLTFDHHDLTARTRLTREKFEELSADLLDRTRFTMHRVLREAGLHWDDVTRVLLTGGSTRMPMVRAMVEKETGRRVDRSVSVDEAVAHGAAIYAGILLARAGGERPNVSVTNVNSHDLGVLGIEPATGRRRRKVLIPRNTPLPATYGSRFVTHVDNQRTVAVPVIEGGDASGQHATTIGKCVVKNLPKRLPKGTTVVVNFTYTENGRLTVNASLPDFQNASATMSIERARGLSDEQIAQWCERITAGLRVGQASSAPSPEAAEALPEDSHFDDADATIFDDIDTIEDADAPNEFLASLGRQRPAEPPEKPKSKAGTKAKDPTPSPPPKMPPLPKKEKTDPPPPPPPLPKAAPDAAKSGDAKIDEPPRKTDEKVDEQVAPDDDDELGRFLRGLK